ncbi:DNA-processing protein DprA [Plantactinospora sp. CA-290183]|uniref:DNA-processing protein DprA n=1 Tax=Plantactinospora sp. CA-290183 TaxID=3240006 RepID=UPI003D90DA4B
MTSIDNPTTARAVLASLTKPGDPDIHALVQNEGPQAILRRLRDYLDAPQLAARIIADTERISTRIVTPQDPEWPSVLDDLTPARRPAGAPELPAPPLCLWVRSARPLPHLLDRAIAVVGARAATPYGQHVAENLGHGLADRGWTVLNAGGYGIDAAALRGALTGGHPAVAMPACGLDRPYPAGHQALFERLDLISAWPPGRTPQRHHFAVNRTWLAALTRATVLVEAALVSDARGVLSHALTLGRPAMAVPGPVTSVQSAGCHQAMRDNPRVRLVRDAADIDANLTDGPGHHSARAEELVARWGPGWVALPGVGGPYPALVADLLSPQGWAIARFDADTIARIAADCDRLAARVGEAAETTRIRLIDGAVHQTRRAGTPDESADIIAADADGYYRLDGWSWNFAEPPTQDQAT